MDIVFLDDNVLFSAAHGPSSKVRALWRLADTQLVTSEYALAEARRNLAKPDEHRALDELMSKVAMVRESIEQRDLPEIVEKDRPILRAAVAARASYLVTGDARHFGAYFGKSIAGVTILTPAQYLQLRS